MLVYMFRGLKLCAVCVAWFLGATACHAGSPQPGKSSLLKFGLLGKVKTCTETVLINQKYLQRGWDEGGEEVEVVEVIDKVAEDDDNQAKDIKQATKEKLVRQKSEQGTTSCGDTPQWRLAGKQQYHFDVQGYLTELRRSTEVSPLNAPIYQANSYIVLPVGESYRYSATGQLIEMRHYLDSRLKSRTKFSYNKHGDLTLEQEYAHQGRLSSETKYSYKYRADGTKSESRAYTSGGEEIYEIRRLYSSDGKIAEAEVLKDNLPSGDKTLYRYDSLGRCIEEQYHSDGSYVADRYRYDSRGNVVETLKVSERSTISYIKRDGKEQTTKTSEPVVYERRTHEYTYDPRGNWLTCKVYSWQGESKELIEQHERVLTYY